MFPTRNRHVKRASGSGTAARSTAISIATIDRFRHLSRSLKPRGRAHGSWREETRSEEEVSMLEHLRRRATRYARVAVVAPPKICPHGATNATRWGFSDLLSA